MFAKVAPLPPDKMPIGTVSVSAGNDNERRTLIYYKNTASTVLLHLKVIKTLSLEHLHKFSKSPYIYLPVVIELKLQEISLL
jgi:hypothetical protein